MDDITKALLHGLKNVGNRKTFDEILREAGFKLDKSQRIDLALELETSGLITNVIYSLPFAIRAELSAIGRSIVETANSAGKNLLNLLFLLIQIVSYSTINVIR